MNWNAIGAMGEVFGAIAVFVTLGYLAVQVGHARREAQRALSQGRGEGIRELFALGTNERISRLMAQGNTAMGGGHHPFVSMLTEQAGLTREEATALFYYQIAWWNYTVQIISNIDDLPDIERRQFEISITARYGTPGVHRAYYEQQRHEPHHEPHPDAIRYIESVLAKAA